MTNDKVLIGAAGAYYVAFRLSALGYAVGLTTHGTRAIDVLVANLDTGKSITLQTKTMRRKAKRRSEGQWWWCFQVGASILKRPSPEAVFYAFVDLKDDESQTPDVFIVPFPKLASMLDEYKGGHTWCSISEKNAQKYQNKWDIIASALA